jgi:N-acyl-D-glutamate deacylase
LGCQDTTATTGSPAQQSEGGEQSAIPGDFDLVILNGRVMDPETGLDAIRNVGVKDGKIVAVTEQAIEGAETIDAKDHVVAPGFIDGHAHTTDIPLGQKALLRDGVTTAMELEGGALPIDRWYEKLEGKSQLNYGASVSASAARTSVFDPTYLEGSESADIIYDMMSRQTEVTLDTYNRVPTDDEVEKILALVEEGLQQGGLGVGVTPGYIVDAQTSKEIIGAQKLAGKYGRFVHAHARFSSQEPPTSGLLGFQEFISSSRVYGGGLIIAHFTAQALDLTEQAIQYVDDLRDKGEQIVLEIYPYNFGDAGTGVSADYLKPDNYQRNMGRTYKDIINSATGEPLTKKTYEALLKKNPFAPVIFYNATEEDMEKGLAHASVLVGCDCFYFTDAKGDFAADWDTPFESVNTHPRSVGSHGKVLRLSREKGLMPLMTAISKMSYQYANFLANNGVAQMANKGRIKVGADADITIFDAATVRDNSSLDRGKNALPTTGIPYVIVNGTVVVKDSKVLEGVYAGKPIRQPVID